MRTVKTWIATLLAGLCGCGHSGNSGGENSAVVVPNQDAAMDAATERARSTINKFIETLANPQAGQEDFSVKVELHDDGVDHALWLQQVSYSDANFTGLLGSEATGMKDHKPGEAITIAATEISDWMYVENMKLVSGFTMRAIRDNLRARERQAFEKSMWFKFD